MACLTLSLIDQTFTADKRLFTTSGVCRVSDPFAVLFTHQFVEAEDAFFSRRGTFDQSVVLSLVLVTFDIQGMVVDMRQEPDQLLVQLVAGVGGDGSEISMEDIK